MSASVYKLVRVDLKPDSYIKNHYYLTYVWECEECGEEYYTSALQHKTSIFCPSCREKHKQNAKIAARNKLKKEQSAALKEVWKDMLNCGSKEIKEVTIDGEKFISKKALEKRFKDLLAQGDLSQNQT